MKTRTRSNILPLPKSDNVSEFTDCIKFSLSTLIIIYHNDMLPIKSVLFLLKKVKMSARHSFLGFDCEPNTFYANLDMEEFADKAHKYHKRYRAS